MASDIDGVDFSAHNDYAICHIHSISDDLKYLIRSNLSTICHGSHIADYLNQPLYNYHTTIASFIERYDKKPENTQKGMIGELLSHILITNLFGDYDIASAFFNLEEKSIKKGFDILLYNTSDNTVWITEVKSGNLRNGKNHDQTTKSLLIDAKSDLKKRLNEQENQYWHNAINHVRASLHDEIDYRNVLIKILREDYGSDAADGETKSQDKNVMLVSNLFEPLDTMISSEPAKSLSESLSDGSVFRQAIVLSIQKSTYDNVVHFLQEEIA
jgi:hypothetical protein